MTLNSFFRGFVYSLARDDELGLLVCLATTMTRILAIIACPSSLADPVGEPLHPVCQLCKYHHGNNTKRT